MAGKFEIDVSNHVKTAFGDFYQRMQNEKHIKYQYQLFTYAFLVGLLENKVNTDLKNKDICYVKSIPTQNLDMITGIALMTIGKEVNDGSELLKKITEYADGGITLIMNEYDINKSIVTSLDRYL